MFKHFSKIKKTLIVLGSMQFLVAGLYAPAPSINETEAKASLENAISEFAFKIGTPPRIANDIDYKKIAADVSSFLEPIYAQGRKLLSWGDDPLQSAFMSACTRAAVKGEDVTGKHITEAIASAPILSS